MSQGIQKLGHISHKVISPNMSLNPARDLGYYRATEAIFNVIRDNENIQRLSLHSGSAKEAAGGELRCHGFNSVKDFLLSKTQLDATTAIESETFSPSNKKGLNCDSSGHISGVVNRSNLKNHRHRRPKTGVASKARNSTNLILFGNQASSN